VGAGAIITKYIPRNSIAYGVNKFKNKDTNYNLLFNSNMIDFHKLMNRIKKDRRI
jgi:serine O-acetyltransferase